MMLSCVETYSIRKHCLYHAKLDKDKITIPGKLFMFDNDIIVYNSAYENKPNVNWQYDLIDVNEGLYSRVKRSILNARRNLHSLHKSHSPINTIYRSICDICGITGIIDPRVTYESRWKMLIPKGSDIDAYIDNDIIYII